MRSCVPTAAKGILNGQDLIWYRESLRSPLGPRQTRGPASLGALGGNVAIYAPRPLAGTLGISYNEK